MKDSFWNTEFQFDCYGEVQKKVDSLSKTIIYIIVLGWNGIPLISFLTTLIVSGFSSTFLSIMLVWYTWFGLSFIKLVDCDATYASVIIKFPLVFPTVAFLKIYIPYLKRHYPNTNDKDEIAKFNRAKKIKSIL